MSSLLDNLSSEMLGHLELDAERLARVQITGNMGPAGEAYAINRLLTAAPALVEAAKAYREEIKNKEAIKSLARKIIVKTKHGPDGKGERGDCDKDCLKCWAESYLKSSESKGESHGSVAGT